MESEGDGLRGAGRAWGNRCAGDPMSKWNTVIYDVLNLCVLTLRRIRYIMRYLRVGRWSYAHSEHRFVNRYEGPRECFAYCRVRTHVRMRYQYTVKHVAAPPLVSAITF